MCASPQQDVDVHLSSSNQERIRITLGDHGMAMGKAYPQSAMLYHFGQSQVGSFGVEITLDNVQIGSRLAQEVICLFVGDIAQAYHLADLARCEEFPEL